VELASLDGAVVVSNSGTLLAYGAILVTGRASGKATEGSRTKAAKAASNLGVTVKVSSDGEISVFKRGVEILAFGG
jgi:DNA integrity scanning protein DisA with diadenylate cyclase activity